MKNRMVCTGCIQEVQADWYCCPYCGSKNHVPTPAPEQLVQDGNAFYNEACAIFDGDAIKHKDAEAYSYFREARRRFRATLDAWAQQL